MRTTAKTAVVALLALVSSGSATAPDRSPPVYPCPASECWCHDRFSDSSINVTRDVSFASVLNRYTGGNETLYLDLYSPPKTNATRAAAVIVHGGGFKNNPNTSTTDSGSKRKSTLVDMAHAFARRGFLVVSVDYRCERTLGGNQMWIDAVADVRKAIDWLQRNQEQHAVDMTRVVAFGPSAGAITVAGLCFMKEEGAEASIRAGISLSGCLFNDTTSLPKGKHVWNHLYTAGPDSPPFIDFHGTADKTVPFSNASARPSSEGRRNESCSATDTHEAKIAG